MNTVLGTVEKIVLKKYAEGADPEKDEPIEILEVQIDGGVEHADN